MTASASRRPPLTPKEGWLIHGRQVLCCRQTRRERDVPLLEISTCLIPSLAAKPIENHLALALQCTTGWILTFSGN